MAVSTEDAWAVPGDAPLPKRDPSYPNQLSQETLAGQWGPAFKVQIEMLEAFAKKYDLEPFWK